MKLRAQNLNCILKGAIGWLLIVFLPTWGCMTRLNTQPASENKGSDSDPSFVSFVPSIPAASLPLSNSDAYPRISVNRGDSPADTNTSVINRPPDGVASAPDIKSGEGNTSDSWSGQGNATPSNPTSVVSDEPVLRGDISRYRFAFFTNKPFEIDTIGLRPFMGVVFTADANFCDRKAAPMHVTEFTMSQINVDNSPVELDSNTVYNVTTWPGIPYLYSPWSPDHLPPGSDLIGWSGTCALSGEPEGGKYFREASWSLSPQDTNTIDSASVVRVSIHARNSAQEIAWTVDAKRCDDAFAYFQNLAGNHVHPQLIPCVRTFLDATGAQQNTNQTFDSNQTGP